MKPNRTFLPYLLLPFFAFLVVSPTLGRFLIGLPDAWAYSHAPSQIETLTVTHKLDERSGRHSSNIYLQLCAADGTVYTPQISDSALWTRLREGSSVTGQVCQGKVMWLRDGATEAQTEDNPASRSRNASYAIMFIALVALIAVWRWAIRR